MPIKVNIDCISFLHLIWFPKSTLSPLDALFHLIFTTIKYIMYLGRCSVCQMAFFECYEYHMLNISLTMTQWKKKCDIKGMYVTMLKCVFFLLFFQNEFFELFVPNILQRQRDQSLKANVTTQTTTTTITTRTSNMTKNKTLNPSPQIGAMV